jgi:FkbM family methyltransferase
MLRRTAFRLFETGVRPLLPKRHRLAAQYRLEMMLGSAEREVRELASLTPGRSVAVDVGANIGIYTYAMSRLFREVWAFEPNPFVTTYLVDAAIKNVRLKHCALSDSTGKAVLRIPIVNNVKLSGFASIDLQDTAGATEHEMLTVDTTRLDDFGLHNVDIIKIDAEGHELPILKGAHRTIADSQPVCLIEVEHSDEAQLDDFFNSFGYARQRHNRCSPQNALFVPQR